MFEITQQQQDALGSLCERYSVVSLELFGSATREDFDHDSSDIDLLVTFAPDTDLGPWLRHFFELKQELSDLFARPVDLMESTSIRNPVLRREIEHSRLRLYAA